MLPPSGVGTDIVDDRPLALPRSDTRQGIRHVWPLEGHERRPGARELVVAARRGVETFESGASLRAALADAAGIPPLRA